MKTYIATLDRDSVSLDLGFKIAVIRNGQTYNESEITSRFPSYFKEVNSKEVAAPKKEEILLVDTTSAVEVVTVEEVKETPVEVVETVETPAIDLVKDTRPSRKK